MLWKIMWWWYGYTPTVVPTTTSTTVVHVILTIVGDWGNQLFPSVLVLIATSRQEYMIVEI